MTEQVDVVEKALGVTPRLPKPIFKSRYGMLSQGFVAHRPGQQRTHEFPFPEPRVVNLKVNLPRRWERVCYQSFRKGNSVTLTGMILFPGAGQYYIFAEGARGSFMLTQEQIDTPMIIQKEEENVSPVLVGSETQVPA